jgi:hypothetical protein
VQDDKSYPRGPPQSGILASKRTDSFALVHLALETPQTCDDSILPDQTVVNALARVTSSAPEISGNRGQRISLGAKPAVAAL